MSSEDIVAGIQAGNKDAKAALYSLFTGRRGHYFPLTKDRQLDLAHDTYLIVLGAIERGALLDPKCLWGFIRTIMRRQIFKQIRQSMKSNECRLDRRLPDPLADPLRSVMDIQEEDRAIEALAMAIPFYRDILTRFYLEEQPVSEICAAMNISATQFYIGHWRARKQLIKLYNKRTKP